MGWWCGVGVFDEINPIRPTQRVKTSLDGTRRTYVEQLVTAVEGAEDLGGGEGDVQEENDATAPLPIHAQLVVRDL